MVYNKLVRDKIPEMIGSQGERANIRILEDEEYRVCLSKKLDEEVQEFHRDRNLEELADIMEVVFALANDLGYSRMDLMEAYQKKHDERGGFGERVFLISKES